MARKKHKRPHGTGSCLRRDGRWVIQWTENGKRRTQSFATEAEARQFLARACAGLEVRQERIFSNSLGEMAQTWMDSRRHLASNYDERNRWKNHLAPAIGHLVPDQVTVPVLKRLIQDLRTKGLSPGTVGLQISLLSSFYGDLVEDGMATVNPVKMLSRKTRRNELTSTWDWRRVPFVRNSDDIRGIYTILKAMDRHVATAYIVGALAGLRTGEVRALRWEHINFETRLIHVQDQAARHAAGVKDLKDKESRFVPLTDTLALYLTMDHDARDRHGLVCSANDHMLDDHWMGAAIASVLAGMELPKMRWYEATRHTFGSQWVLNGGSLETLREMMGHSSVTVTERYAHLIPGNYTAADRSRVVVDAQPAVSELVN